MTSLLAHRGFHLRLHRPAAAGAATGFAFSVRHGEHAVHRSAPAYRSAVTAERAARQFVDDALGAYHAASALASGAPARGARAARYSSSK